jgi:hypothetical protein
MGGVALFDVFEYIVVIRLPMLKFMFERSQPWTNFLIQNLGVRFGNMKMGMNWCNVINSPRQIMIYAKYWVDNQIFLSSWSNVL